LEVFETKCKIPSEYEGERIDKVLAKLCVGVSRSQISAWIQSSTVFVNNSVVKASYRVKGGELVAVGGMLNPTPNWTVTSDVNYKILFEDEHLLVVDKPAGLVTHPGKGNERGTLVNGLIGHRTELANLPRAGIVHRLDKNTSGLLVVAVSKTAFNELTLAISKHEISRRYVAIVEGILEHNVRVDLPIGRHVTQRTLRQVRNDGRPAVTDFQPIERYRKHTLVEAKLRTGRTHQIRVHAQALSIPIVGDVAYGARGLLPKLPSVELSKTVKACGRQALHAKRLQFRHPVTQKDMKFVSQTPSDIQELIYVLQRDAKTSSLA